MLSAHPDIAISFESYFMVDLLRQRARGVWPANIAADRNWNRLLQYVTDHPWIQSWELDSRELEEGWKQIPDRSYSAACRAVFTLMMRNRSKSRWGDKTPQHVQYMLVLTKLFPDAKFIHIIRDGRDTALSLVQMRKTAQPWGPRFIALAGYYWAWLVLSGLIAQALLGANQCIEVRFEDLVLQPEEELKRLCSWAGLTYDARMLDYCQTEMAQEFARDGSASRRRIGKPPDKTRIQLWKNRMDLSDQKKILRQAGGLLAYLGYEIEGLPVQQHHVKKMLDRVLNPEHIMVLARDVLPHNRSEWWMRMGLRWDRLRQLEALIRGRVETFARCSIRWQRTVGSLFSD